MSLPAPTLQDDLEATDKLDATVLTSKLATSEEDDPAALEHTVSIELNFKAFADHVPPTEHAKRVTSHLDPSIQDFADQALELATLRAEIKRLTRDYDAMVRTSQRRDQLFQALRDEFSNTRARLRDAIRQLSEARSTQVPTTLDPQTVEPSPVPPTLQVAQVVEPARAAPTMQAEQVVVDPSRAFRQLLQTAQIVEPSRAAPTLQAAQVVVDPSRAFRQLLQAAQIIEPSRAAPTLQAAQVVEPSAVPPTLQAAQVVEPPRAAPTVRAAQVVEASRAAPTLQAAQVVEPSTAPPTARAAQVVEPPRAAPSVQTAQVVEPPCASPTVQVPKGVAPTRVPTLQPKAAPRPTVAKPRLPAIPVSDPNESTDKLCEALYAATTVLAPKVLASLPASTRQLQPLDHDGKPIVLDRDIITIGRTKKSDVCIASPAISRDHARLLVMRNSVTIIDMDSGNGCFVNAERVSKCRLREGDVITIGDRSYRLVHVAAAEAS